MSDYDMFPVRADVVDYFDVGNATEFATVTFPAHRRVGAQWQVFIGEPACEWVELDRAVAIGQVAEMLLGWLP